MKNLFMMLSLLVAALSFAGCGGRALGSTTIAGTTFAVRQEGSGSPGSSTRYVLQPAAGRGTIRTVRVWVGNASVDVAARVPAVYDAEDNEFVAYVVVPSPLPESAALWISVEDSNSGVTYGSLPL